MQSKRILFLALLAFTIGTNGLFANYAFKKKVKSVCKSYRLTVESSQLSLAIDEFSMTLESNRNNFEMVMLVGFASAGQAIAHQIQLDLANAYTPPKVIIFVEAPVSKGEKNIFMASCSSEQAISLAEGRMDSSQFMQEIMKNMEIN